ncbi:hypothetical protein [Streptomyces shenzhenensis]|uniref:hypothetical protein n=1 Tax=Streptomyces shenzhenensis TaxID=943815 RepID=UPI0035586B35
MTGVTLTEPLGPTDGAACPVRHREVPDRVGAAFDPALSELMREGPVTRSRLPNGEGRAWPVTWYDDVRMVADAPRFSRDPEVFPFRTGAPIRGPETLPVTW